MSVLWFYPLIPAALFFLGAMIIRGDIFRLSTKAKTNISLVIINVVFLTLASRVALQLTASSSDPPHVFSGWIGNAALTVRIDGLSLAFLFIPVLLLLAVFLAQSVKDPALLLSLAGGSVTVFVTANGLVLDYALFLFDGLSCLYWFTRKQPNLAISRLFLGLLTTTALTLEGLGILTPASGVILGFVLWLRLGLWPFVELSMLSIEAAEQNTTMIWVALSTVVGLYISARFLKVPLSPVLSSLLIGVMLLNAWLAWATNPVQVRYRLLRFILTQPCLALLMVPQSAQIAITMSLGYSLALGALWLTPQLGRPNILERHWLWVYAAPLLATLSLIRVPYTFGWDFHDQIYRHLLAQNGGLVQLGFVILAEGFAFSTFYHYWVMLLWPAQKPRQGNLWAALVLTTPFLIPGIAGVMFEAITGKEVAQFGPLTSASAHSLWPLLILGLIWVLALLLGHRQIYIRYRLGGSNLVNFVSPFLAWSWTGGQRTSQILARFILGLKSILEGPHYLGWALLLTLAGLLGAVLN